MRPRRSARNRDGISSRQRRRLGISTATGRGRARGGVRSHGRFPLENPASLRWVVLPSSRPAGEEGRAARGRERGCCHDRCADDIHLVHRPTPFVVKRYGWSRLETGLQVSETRRSRALVVKLRGRSRLETGLQVGETRRSAAPLRPFTICSLLPAKWPGHADQMSELADQLVADAVPDEAHGAVFGDRHGAPVSQFL
jgi:hypothetical protein